jgi:hypothetical protein
MAVLIASSTDWPSFERVARALGVSVTELLQ